MTHNSAHTPADHEAPDQWHHHDPASEERPQKPHGEITNAHLIGLFGIGAAIIVVICSVAVYAYYINYTTRLLDERESAKVPGLEAEARSYKAAALDKLNRGYVWADHEHVQLPIADAINQVAKQYANIQPGSTPNPSAQ